MRLPEWLRKLLPPKKTGWTPSYNCPIHGGVNGLTIRAGGVHQTEATWCMDCFVEAMAKLVPPISQNPPV